MSIVQCEAPGIRLVTWSAVFLMLLAGATVSEASLINNSTGLSSPAATIDFGSNDFPIDTQITTQYAGQGLANAGGLYYSNPYYLFPGREGALLGNFLSSSDGPTGIYPFTLTFTMPQTDAAFALVTDSDDSDSSTITALLGNTVVESFSVFTNLSYADGNNFYGFTGIVFDSIQVTPFGGNHLALIDTVQLGTFQPDASHVPEPSSLVLFSIGGVGLSVGAYRRRRAAV